MQYEFLNLFDLHNTGAIAVKNGVVAACNETAFRLFPGLGEGAEIPAVLSDLCARSPDGTSSAALIETDGKNYHAVYSASGDIGVITLSAAQNIDRDTAPLLSRQAQSEISTALSNNSIAAGLLKNHIELSDDPAALKYYALLIHSQRTLVRIMDNLSTLSGDPALSSKSCIDIIELLANLTEDVNDITDGAFPAIRFSTDVNEFFINGSSHDLQQMFLNVLSNSLKHTPKDGKILLSAQKSGGRINISVTDTGCGIPPRVMGAIFQSYSIQNEPGVVPDGIGIGLASAQKVAKLHNGTMMVTSGPDGTTVLISLPKAEATNRLRNPGINYHAANRNSTVLTGLSGVLTYESFYPKFTD